MPVDEAIQRRTAAPEVVKTFLPFTSYAGRVPVGTSAGSGHRRKQKRPHAP